MGSTLMPQLEGLSPKRLKLFWLSSLESGSTASGSVVDASLADLTEAVGSACEAGVVNEVAGARNTGHKNPVATVVDVEDDSSALSEVVLDVVGVVCLANEAETEGVDGTPDEEVALNIAAIVSEEGVQSLGGGLGTSNRPTTVSNNHGNGGHEAASLADGLSTGSELVGAPTGVTLLVEGI